MGIGEDEREDAKDAGASQSAAGGTAVPAATGEPSADLPTMQAPERDPGAKPEGGSNGPQSTVAKASPVGGPSQHGTIGARALSRRFAPLAAVAALAAGAGAFLGALTAGSLAYHPPASAAVARTADEQAATASVKAQLAALTALKASLERVNRSANAQFAKIGQRLDSLQSAQAAPAAKLGHIADTLDQLEKQRADQPGKQRADQPGQQRAAASDATGSITGNAPTKTSAPARPAAVLRDWIVDDLRDGRAMVESRYGDVFVVGAGSVLPGLGRVEQIERQDGRWVVVTASGLITSPR